jgi:hypothetical protein
MELNWYCIEVIGMKQQAAGEFYGFSRGHKWAGWKSKETNSMTSDASEQTPGQIHRVAIVNSVITKILNPYKHWMVMIQPLVLYVRWISVHSLLYLLPVSILIVQLFNSHLFLFCLCSIHFLRLFSVQLFVYSVLFSILILKLDSRYFDPHFNNHLGSQ